MKKLVFQLVALAAGLAAGLAAAGPAAADEQLTVAMYAPAAAFADSSARVAYIQGLAKAIQQKTGQATTGKIFVRLGDLLAAKPDFAIIDGQCLAAHAFRGASPLDGQSPSSLPWPILASAVAGGDTQQSWGLYTRGGETLGSLKGKKLVTVKTGCRDTEFLDNAMLESEVKTASYFGALVEKPDVAGAVATVRDYKAADAVFAPAGQARGLTKVYDAGSVPNAGFVALKTFPPATQDAVRDAVLAYGGGGGIDGWRAAAQASYAGLGARMTARSRRPVFAVPDVVRLDDQDVLVLPASRYEQATVKQHFWEPSSGNE